MCLQYNSFENTVEKGEIARDEQFLIFPQYFLFYFFWKNVSFSLNLEFSSAKSFCLEASKICHSGKGWYIET